MDEAPELGAHRSDPAARLGRAEARSTRSGDLHSSRHGSMAADAQIADLLAGSDALALYLRLTLVERAGPAGNRGHGADQQIDRFPGTAFGFIYLERSFG